MGADCAPSAVDCSSFGHACGNPWSLFYGRGSDDFHLWPSRRREGEGASQPSSLASGFEASQINFKGEQPMGFALFSTAHHALAGKSALQDLLFDSETKSTLHTEMAKKNLFVKRGVGTDFSTLDQSKRMRTVGDYAHTGYLSPSAFHPQSAPFWPAPSYMAPPAPYDPYGGYVNQIALPTPPVPTPGGYALVQNTKDNPPCNTLFVGNLGENVLEEELRSLFSIQPGYKQMKILRHERNTVCFIEFDDVNNAITVHQNLQGAVLPSSGRGESSLKTPLGDERTRLTALLQKQMEQQNSSSKSKECFSAFCAFSCVVTVMGIMLCCIAIHYH
ncbi:hypothetical protein HPP92_013475 [Vanilla planifolia]|uniref:RRM domain-containing protein n=1 Tax=Vanilla planifolia TaxID=51239 RepID=A0A835UUU7_VANPL|nr:hypothetical protein HPP92_013475 [Vanilla planifolia]